MRSVTSVRAWRTATCARVAKRTRAPTRPCTARRPVAMTKNNDHDQQLLSVASRAVYTTRCAIAQQLLRAPRLRLPQPYQQSTTIPQVFVFPDCRLRPPAVGSDKPKRHVQLREIRPRGFAPALVFVRLLRGHHEPRNNNRLKQQAVHSHQPKNIKSQTARSVLLRVSLLTAHPVPPL
jgi:hypothetical protein